MEIQRVFARALQGDEQAFEELVHTQAARLYGIAYRVTGDRETADDVLQETFLRLLSTTPPTNPVRSVPSWLAKVTARVAISTVRSQRARSRREARYATERKNQLAHAAAGKSLPQDLEPEVSVAFQALSPETRVAVWLHVVEEEGVREVADCLDSSRSAVSRSIRAGLDTMRQHLARRGCALPAALPLEGLVRALPTPTPATGVLEKILATGKAATAASGPKRVRSDPAALRSSTGNGGYGGFLGSKKVALSAGLSLAILAGLTFLVLLWTRLGTPGHEERARRAEGITSQAQPPAAPAPPSEALPGSQETEEEPAPGKGEPFGIRGTVVFERQPVEGASVRALRYAVEKRSGWTFERVYVRGEFGEFLDLAFQPPEVLNEAKADADGRFRLTVGERGVILLAATKETGPGVVLGGLQPLQVTEDTEGNEVAAEVLLELFADEFLSGTVIDSKGVGAAGAAVAAFPVDHDLYLACTGQLPSSTRRTQLKTAIYARLRESIEAFEVSCTTTAASGRFLFPRLDPADAYLVAVRSEGHASAFTGPLELPAGGLEIKLGAAKAIAGEAVIVPEGVPARGVRILVVGGLQSPSKMRGFLRSIWFDLLQPDSAAWFDVVEADAQGRFSARGGEPGIEGCALGCLDKSGAVLQAGTNWNTRRPLELPLRIEFHAGLNVSKGRILDATNRRPIAGAQVRYYTGGDGVMYVAAEQTTDGDGAYSLATWREGLIIGERDGYAPGARAVHSERLARMPPQVQAALGAEDIALTPSPVIRGTVVGPDGHGVSGCFLEVIRCAPTQGKTFAAIGKAVEEGALGIPNFLVAERFFQEHAWIFDSSPAPRGQAWTDDRGQFEFFHPFGHEGLFLWAGHAELGEVLRGPLDWASGHPPEVKVHLQLPGLATVDLLVADGAGGVLSGVPVRCREDANVAPADGRADSAREFLKCLERWRSEVSREREKERAYRKPPQVLMEARGTTDAFGKCRFDIQAGVPFELTLEMKNPDASGQASGAKQWQCSLSATQPLQIGQVRLFEVPFPRDQILRGRVIDEEGNGLRASVNVHAEYHPAAEGGLTGNYATWGTSNEDGSFVIRAAGPGPFELSVRARGFRSAKLEDVQAAMGDVSVQLQSE